MTDPSPPNEPPFDPRRHWSPEEREAFERLLPLVHIELQRVALALVRGDRSEHRLEASALVQAALIRSSQRYVAQWRSRLDFYRWATGLMRQVLIDHARAQRIAGAPLGGDNEASQIGLALMAVDDALRKLERLEERIGFADTSPMPPPRHDNPTSR